MTPRREQAIANALTLSRVPLAAAVAATLDRPVVAFALIAVAAATDAADGRVARHARRRGARGTAGDWLDPLCDKLFVSIVAVALGARTGAWGVLAVLGARELAMVALAPVAWRRRARLPWRANALGKAATDAQLAALAVLVIAPAYAWPVAALAGALGIAAVARYALG